MVKICEQLTTVIAVNVTAMSQTGLAGDTIHITGAISHSLPLKFWNYVEN